MGQARWLGCPHCCCSVESREQVGCCCSRARVVCALDPGCLAADSRGAPDLEAVSQPADKRRRRCLTRLGRKGARGTSVPDTRSASNAAAAVVVK